MSRVYLPYQQIIGHFRDDRWVFPVNHLHWYWLRNKNNQETQHTNNTNSMQKGDLVNSTTDTLKKSRLRERRDRAWFSHLVWHLARKWSGSILTSPEPPWGIQSCVHAICNQWWNEAKTLLLWHHSSAMILHFLHVFKRSFASPFRCVAAVTVLHFHLIIRCVVSRAKSSLWVVIYNLQRWRLCFHYRLCLCQCVCEVTTSSLSIIRLI